MKQLILVLMISSDFSASENQPLSDEGAAYRAAYSNWENSAFGGASLAEVNKTYDDLRHAWESAPAPTKELAAYDFAKASLHTASKCMTDGNHQRASSLLGYAGDVAKNYPVVLSRGKSKTAFQDTATLHAKVIATTNNDPLEGVPIGYELGQQGKMYYAIQVSPPNDKTVSEASPIALSDLSSEETAGTLLVIDQDGRVTKSLPVAIKQKNNDGESLRSRVTSVYIPTDPTAASSAKFTRISPTEFFSTVNQQQLNSGGTQRTKELPTIEDSSKSIEMAGHADKSFETDTTGNSATTAWVGCFVILSLTIIGVLVRLKLGRGAN